MTRRKRQTLAPTLFPFLAVLVCTLGTLILLLTLVSQNAATAAEQRARDEPADQHSAPLSDTAMISAVQAAALIDDATVRIESLQAARNSQAADLEARRDQLTHLEDHIGRLTDQLSQLANEAKIATATDVTNTDSHAKLLELQQSIAEYQRQVEDLRQEVEQTAPRVVIVPHKGPNGTTRRPIYVECTRRGLTIWPEGVEIPTEYLSERRHRGANPLDAALRVARLHTMRVYGDADPPYPLLVVRPHGTDAYFAATTAMHDWDDQYGYEMLDSGIELAVGAPDPNLRRRMEEAVAAAIEQHGSRPARRPTPLSASQLAQDGRNRGFGYRPGHGYGDNRNGSTSLDPANSIGHAGSQTSRLNHLYRQAASELREHDGLSGTGSDSDAGIEKTGQPTARSGRESERPSGTASSGQNGGTNLTPASPDAGEVAQAPEPGNHASRDSTPANPQIQIDDASKKRVTRSGKNWALPASVAAARGISIVRSIQVQCHHDRLVVLASRREPQAVFPFHDDMSRSVLEFATEIRDRVERWGVALNDGRWQPVLNVEVVGNADHRFHELSAFMDGSGIDVVQRSAP